MSGHSEDWESECQAEEAMAAKYTAEVADYIASHRAPPPDHHEAIVELEALRFCCIGEGLRAGVGGVLDEIYAVRRRQGRAAVRRAMMGDVVALRKKKGA